MAEILGLASSIITIVEVAGKLGTKTIRLKRLWDEVQDVPASIQRCIEQLEILAPAIEEMDHEFERTRTMIRNDSAAKRSLEYSRKAVETLDTLVRDMESQISVAKTTRRLVAQLKVRIKRDVIEDHQQRLTSALQLLFLSQQTYLIALSRAQPEIIVSEIRNWRESEYRSKFRQALKKTTSLYEVRNLERHRPASPKTISSPLDLPTSVYGPPESHCREGGPAYWGVSLFSLMRLSKALHTTTRQTRHDSFKQGNIRPWNTEIFDAVVNGEVEHIIELLKNKEASIYDVSPDGQSLLDIAITSEQIESIKALVRMGMRIYDIEPSDLFICIYLCFWRDPQVESPMELGRQWTAEIGGGISSEYLDSHAFSDSFWRVPSVYTLLSETGSVRQLLDSFAWFDVNPAVPLELIKSGLFGTSDFPPYICSFNSDGICDCHGSTLILQYFHALLNNDKSFRDWRCLARKALLGVSPLDIVHPHDGAFWNLASILEALWKRQFRLLPFARWIQSAVALWFEDLAAAGINLKEYMSLELLYSRDIYQKAACKSTKEAIQPGARLPESGPSLVILSVGPRADDWSFSWDPCVEELSGEFWATLENSQIKVPGAWVDERTEDFECLMGDPTMCWFRRQEKYYKNTSSMATNGNLKEEHMQAMHALAGAGVA